MHSEFLFKKKHKVVIITRTAGRWGDATAAIRFKNEFEKYECEVTLLSFDMNDKEIGELEEIHGKGTFKTSPNLNALIANPTIQKYISEADMVFIIPTVNLFDYQLGAIQGLMKKDSNFRLIAENDMFYTVQPFPFLTQMGLSSASPLGIIFDETIKDNNANYAEQLSMDLKNIIFGNNQDYNLYQNNTDLFLGYINNIDVDNENHASNILGFFEFIEIIISISTKNIDLIINNNLPKKYKLALMSMPDIPTLQELEISKLKPPLLIKSINNNKFYIYGRSVNKDKILTELDAEVLKELSFDVQEIRVSNIVNVKIYNEIVLKEGHAVSRDFFIDNLKYILDHTTSDICIGKIILVDKNSKEEDVINITNNPNDKVIRILNVYPLAFNDMELLSKISHPFTLLTGDHSFLSGLRDKHVVLYQAMYWKRISEIGFLEVIKNSCGQDSDYYKFANLGKNIKNYYKNITEMIKILKKKDIYSDAKKLKTYLQQYKNCFSEENFNKLFIKNKPQEIVHIKDSNWILIPEHVDFDYFNLIQLFIKGEGNYNPNDIKIYIENTLSMVINYVNLDAPDSFVKITPDNKEGVINLIVSNKCETLHTNLVELCAMLDDKNIMKYDNKIYDDCILFVINLNLINEGQLEALEDFLKSSQDPPFGELEMKKIARKLFDATKNLRDTFSNQVNLEYLNDTKKERTLISRERRKSI